MWNFRSMHFVGHAVASFFFTVTVAVPCSLVLDLCLFDVVDKDTFFFTSCTFTSMYF